MKIWNYILSFLTSAGAFAIGMSTMLSILYAIRTHKTIKALKRIEVWVEAVMCGILTLACFYILTDLIELTDKVSASISGIIGFLGTNEIKNLFYKVVDTTLDKHKTNKDSDNINTKLDSEN